MQVIFIMGLFMFVFSVVMGLTTTLTRSTMQLKAKSVDSTYQIFLDIEKGILDGVLSNQSDLRVYHNNFRAGESGRFIQAPAVRTALYEGAGAYPGLQRFVSWSSDDLVNDPWGSEVQVYYSTRHIFMDNNVEAPETVFAFVSPGPNKRFETALTGSAIEYDNIAALEAADSSDDIVHVFTTYKAINRTWQAVLKALNGATGLIAANYTEQYIRFLPRIEQFNTAQFNAGAGFGFDNASLNAWMTDSTFRATYALEYPSMITSIAQIDLSDYVSKVPRFGDENAVDLLDIRSYGSGQPYSDHRTRLRMRINVGAGTNEPSVGWEINHQKVIDGRAIISN